jgi:hypothetical protein
VRRALKKLTPDGRANPSPGKTLVVADLKWVRGLEWSAIDADLQLTYKTLRGDVLNTDVQAAPMILEEIGRLFPDAIVNDRLDRSTLPAEGPIVISEFTGYPWKGVELRRRWRFVADDAGLPRSVRSGDRSQSRELDGSRLIRFQAENRQLRDALKTIGQLSLSAAEMAHLANTTLQELTGRR